MSPPSLSETRPESLIGTATPADTFILIETPQPWIKPALLSDGLPESLRQLVKSLLGPGTRTRVHLIANEYTSTHGRRRILIFQRASLAGNPDPGFFQRPIGEYKAWTIDVATPEEMAPALSEFLGQSASAKRISRWRDRSAQRHLMICTHASHNDCCGIYGYPFYQETITHIQQMKLTSHIQPWEISHIGGHRFAPTLIDFPQGRYYGNLNEAALECLLKQRGAIAPLLSTYRGWSLLPKPLQILEKKLWQQHGWKWLKGRVTGRILHQAESQNRFQVELWFESPEQLSLQYIADIHNNQIEKYRQVAELEPSVGQLTYPKTG
ncbi:MAG: sucrase ferredoxin [Leptolyngbya sp. SIO1D8]|nr:sucrase ferredoxin [Leptolyngbya sp. SIO1D8]